MYLSGYQTFWKLQGFRRLRSDLSGFLNRKDTTEHATNQSRVHDNSFTSTTVTNCSNLPGENKLLLYFLIELLTHIRVVGAFKVKQREQRITQMDQYSMRNECILNAISQPARFFHVFQELFTEFLKRFSNPMTPHFCLGFALER